MRIDSELKATWDSLGAILGPPEAALGLSWASLGCLLEPLGALSGALEALSGALGAVLGRSCGSLRRFKTQSVEMTKTFKHLRKINVFLGSASPRCGQDGAKMGQVGFKLALFEIKLESSWHVEAMWPSSCHHGPSWPHLGGNLEAIWANLSRLRGVLGSKALRSGSKRGS